MDQQQIRDKKLSSEAARWRVQFRAAQQRITQLETENAALRSSTSPASTGPTTPAAPAASGTPAPADDNTNSVASSEAGSPDVSAGAGEVELIGPDDVAHDGDSYATDTDVENFEAQLRAYFVRELGNAGALVPEDALDLMIGRGQVVFGDDLTPALVIDGTPQPITYESLGQLLHPSWMRSRGVGGAGSHASRPMPTGGGFDSGRFLSDPAYRATVNKGMRGRR